MKKEMLYNSLYQDEKFWLCLNGASVARFGNRFAEIRNEQGEALWVKSYTLDEKEGVWLEFSKELLKHHNFQCSAKLAA